MEKKITSLLSSLVNSPSKESWKEFEETIEDLDGLEIGNAHLKNCLRLVSKELTSSNPNVAHISAVMEFMNAAFEDGPVASVLENKKTMKIFSDLHERLEIFDFGQIEYLQDHLVSSWGSIHRYIMLMLESSKDANKVELAKVFSSTLFDGIAEQRHNSDTNHKRECAEILVALVRRVKFIQNKKPRCKSFEDITSKMDVIGILVSDIGDYSVQKHMLELAVRLCMWKKGEREKYVKQFCEGLSSSSSTGILKQFYSTFLNTKRKIKMKDDIRQFLNNLNRTSTKKKVRSYLSKRITIGPHITLFKAWIDLGQTSFTIDWDQHLSPKKNPSTTNTSPLYREPAGSVSLEVKYPDINAVAENSLKGTIQISLSSELENLSNGPPLPRKLRYLELEIIPRVRSDLVKDLTIIQQKNKDTKQQRKMSFATTFRSIMAGKLEPQQSDKSNPKNSKKQGSSNESRLSTKRKNQNHHIETKKRKSSIIKDLSSTVKTGDSNELGKSNDFKIPQPTKNKRQKTNSKLTSSVKVQSLTDQTNSRRSSRLRNKPTPKYAMLSSDEDEENDEESESEKINHSKSHSKKSLQKTSTKNIFSKDVSHKGKNQDAWSLDDSDRESSESMENAPPESQDGNIPKGRLPSSIRSPRLNLRQEIQAACDKENQVPTESRTFRKSNLRQEIQAACGKENQIPMESRTFRKSLSTPVNHSAPTKKNSSELFSSAQLNPIIYGSQRKGGSRKSSFLRQREQISRDHANAQNEFVTPEQVGEVRELRFGHKKNRSGRALMQDSEFQDLENESSKLARKLCEKHESSIRSKFQTAETSISIIHEGLISRSSGDKTSIIQHDMQNFASLLVRWLEVFDPSKMRAEFMKKMKLLNDDLKREISVYKSALKKPGAGSTLKNLLEALISRASAEVKEARNLITQVDSSEKSRSNKSDFASMLRRL